MIAFLIIWGLPLAFIFGIGWLWDHGYRAGVPKGYWENKGGQ